MANLRSAAARAARAYGIPPELFMRLVQVESGWQPQIVSSAGAIGLTQLMPGTARGLGVDPHNPIENLNGGAKYLRAMFDRFGNWKLALAAYNAGAGAVEQHGGIPPYPQTQHYVSMILGGIKMGAKTLQGVTAPPTIQPEQAQSFSSFGPDLAGVGLKNLSEGADPLRSLENLTSEVAYSANMGVAQSAAPASTGALGMPQGSQVSGGGNSKLAQLASRYIGTPYVWGGSSPNGFDCSGLLQYVAHQAGIKGLGRTTYQQWGQGTPVGRGQLQPGDAVFFRGSDSRGGLPGHVGIYIGRGLMIDAPHTGARVRVESVNNFGGYMGARRY